MVEGKYNFCHIAERTDVGCKRSANEDWLVHFESPNGLVAVVCDGMGGHVGGQIASHTAIEAIQGFLMRESPLSPQELIVEAIKQANDAILYRANQQPELKGMGATCVLLIVREDGRVYIGSVGDSRVYLNRSHRLIQLTKDQSYVQTLVDAGAITPEQAEIHPRKNEITNALGLPNMQPATVLSTAFVPEAGDCFLLCSDGLSGMVSDNEMCKIISRQGEMSQQDRVNELVNRALKNGGLDNITCQLVEFAVSPKGSSNKWFNNKTLWGVLALLLTVFGGCAWWWLKHAPKEDEGIISKKIKTNISPKDSVVYLKPILFQKGKTFLEIREHKNLGIELTEYPYNSNDTTVSKPNLILKNMAVTSQEKLEIRYVDSTRCDIAFKQDLKDVTEIAVALQDKENSIKYWFILPVKKKNAPTTEYDSTESPKNGQDYEEKDYTKLENEHENEDKEDENIWSNPDVTVQVNKANFIICINPKDGVESDYTLRYNCSISVMIFASVRIGVLLKATMAKRV